MEKIKEVIQSHPFFDGLPEEHLSVLADGAQRLVFQPGQTVFNMGEPADLFYLVRRGRIALDVYSAEKGPITIQTLKEGSVLGWSWIVPPYTWRFDARAVELSRLLAFDGVYLRQACEEDPVLGYAVLKKIGKIVADRLHTTRFQLLDIYGASAEKR